MTFFGAFSFLLSPNSYLLILGFLAFSLRLFIVKKLFIQKIYGYFILSSKFSSYVTMLQLTLLLLLVTHVLGCFWVYLAEFEIKFLNCEHTWMHKFNIQKQSTYDK